MDLQKAWNNLIENEGSIFQTISGLEFTDSLSKDHKSFITNRTKYGLSRTNFDKAYKLMPAKNTHYLSDNGVRGPSYLFALLTQE